jgi:hypothetical protein
MMTTRDVSQGEAEGNESWLAHFPVTFFAVVMGLSGLTLATHRIELKFAVSHTASLALTAITTLVFLAISTVFVAKAIRRSATNGTIRSASPSFRLSPSARFSSPPRSCRGTDRLRTGFGWPPPLPISA